MPDRRTYIKVHDGLPDHPKIEGLSDKAFRILVSTWCWSKRQHTDGLFQVEAWKRRGPARARAELEAEMVHGHDHTCSRCPPVPVGYVRLHDYLEHQTPAAEIAAKQEDRRSASIRANHRRWHTNRNVTDPNCPLCDPNGLRTGSPPESESDSARTPVGDHTESQEVEAEAEKRTLDLRGDRPVGHRARSSPRDLAATAHSPAAHRLVEAFAATRPRRPPARVLAKLGPLVDELLGEDWPPELVAVALRTWGDKGLDPATLPSVANEIANRAPSAGRPSTTDQRTAAVQALKADFHDHPTNQHTEPAHRRQLTRESP